MGIHDGHRDRLKTRFLEEGLDGFTEVQALELLLFYAIPRRDTNEMAHRLLESFGTLDKVFEADYDALCQVEGVGPGAASLIRLTADMNRRRVLSRSKPGTVFKSADAAGALFLELFRGQREEQIYLLCLDQQYRLIKCVKLFSGSLLSVSLDQRKLVETALKWNAASVILAHNHVGGPAVPSQADAASTDSVKRTLAAVGVCLEDHIIVAGDEFISMKNSGMLR